MTGVEKKSANDPLHTQVHVHPLTPVPPAEHKDSEVLCETVYYRVGRALRYTYGRKITHGGCSGGLYKLPASINV